MSKDRSIRIDEFDTLCDFYDENNLIRSNENLCNWLLDGGFFTAPASTKYHGNYEGGLFDHSLAVADTLIELTKHNNLKWQRPESPLIIGLFHDLCKCDQYQLLDGQYVYNDNLLLKGHGDKSVMILSRFMSLTEEEILCIRYHMGAYEKDDWQGYDLAIRKYPNLLYVHLADMYASKVIGT